MAEIKLTPQQEKAATDRGGSLLVSAAAGSGKTKVLVERLFDYIKDGSCSVDDFLIITYTKAAAAELRSKIAAELSRRVAREPGNAHLRRQLYRVYQADIKTVDAFCASLLRENVYLLPPVEGRSLTPDFRVLDEQEAKLIRLRVLEKVLEEFYQHIDEPCNAVLAETLGAGRDDRNLVNLVLEVYGKLQSHVYPMESLRWMQKAWETLPDSLEKTDQGSVLMTSVAKRVDFWLKRLTEALDGITEKNVMSAYGPVLQDGIAQLQRFGKAETWAGMVQNVPVLGSLKAVRGESLEKEGVKALWNECKADIKKLLAPFQISMEEHLEDLAAMAPAMQALCELTKRFSDAYQKEKVRLGALDFSDQEHYAITLLLDENGAATELAQQVAHRYREIMVDEYQDTNEVQNRIFEAISRDGKNLFTVGDVKQSIYRFRLADPGIFIDKYTRFTDVDKAAFGEDRRVVLSENFRSRKEVLSATNFIFGNIMSTEMGEMEYGDQEALHFGASYYPDVPDRAAEYHLISVVNTEEEQFDRSAVEAEFVAERIETMLREGFEVHGGEQTMRPCRADDFAIVMRSPRSRLHAFTAALTRRGIPCGVEESGEFFETVEIAVAYSMLQIIDNPRQDVPLISVLRSPLYGFTPDRLAAVRGLQRSGDFYEALLRDKGEDTAAFLRDLEQLRNAAREERVDAVMWRMLHEHHLLAVFGAMESGAVRRQNLLSFYAYARTMAGSGKGSVFEFVTHLRRLLETGEVPPLSGKQSVGGVQLMSIHKSKGLEFPIVFLCDLSKRFDKRDTMPAVLVHPKLGLGCDRVDPQRKIRYETVSKTAVAQQLRREALAEEMRILYVAMTRAQEKLIAVDCRTHVNTAVKRLSAAPQLPAAPEMVGSASCLGDWLLLPLLCTPQGHAVTQICDAACPILDGAGGGWRVFAWENPTALQNDEESEEAVITDLPQSEQPFDSSPLEAVYAYHHAAAIPTKVTATQLKGRRIDEELRDAVQPTRIRAHSFDKPQFLKPQMGLTAAEKGTAVHTVMQYIDFSTPPHAAAVAEAVEQLQRKKILSLQQAEAVNCELVTRFLASPLCARICRAEKVYREYRFALLVDAAIYDPAAAGEEMVLQGVADCAFVEDGKLIVVDFKTDRVTTADVSERAESYRVQLNAYAHALSQIMEMPVAEKVVYFFHTNSAISL